ncbi:hypothetical protein [Clostridium sp.]|uniref:hypothetical protein n=1 Tax=Clostridium sp. TaxID=1506 RepID=UPI001D747CA0|nr:hypothetical protein [Clostridium sp.]MBS5308853.1 hypothetical protein [Clostridium sp.]
MEMIQRDVEHDSLELDRKNLIENTGVIRKKRFMKEIHMDNDKLIDEIQMGFINENPELSFEECRLIKKFSDYMKGVK